MKNSVKKTNKKAAYKYEDENCQQCRGYGIVADYGNGEDFYGDKECPSCKGSGRQKVRRYLG